MAGKIEDPNLKTFYNRLTKEPLLYKYQFYITFVLDPALKEEIGSDIIDDMQYLAQSTSIPSETLSTGTVTFFGKDFKVPGVKQFEHNWSVEFIMQENFDLYKTLRAWQRHQSDLSKNSSGIRKLENNYANVSVLDESSQKVVRTFSLKGLWIKTIPEISLAYKDGGGDALTKFKVEFRYQYPINDGQVDNIEGNTVTDTVNRILN